MFSFFKSFAPFGKIPKGRHSRRIKNSAQFNKTKGEFDNETPNLEKDINSRTYTFKNLLRWFFLKNNRIPQGKLPSVRPRFRSFQKYSEFIKLMWVGHSSFLININRKIILMDPVLSRAASPFSFIFKRFQDSTLKPRFLKKIDFVVISHDHYDHLDMETIKNFIKTKTRFIVPLGVGSHLISWGISRKRIKELDWWESCTIDSIEFIATPAQHFSGRNFFEHNKTLWASWVIKSKEHNIYFSGDSGYADHFKKIGDKYGPFDIAFIESGQYDEIWKELHLMPEEFLKVYQDLKARKYFPIHWGVFELSFHPWYEPIEFLFSKFLNKEIDLICSKMGEIVTVDGNYRTIPWWRK